MEEGGIPKLLCSSEDKEGDGERIACNIVQLIGWTPLIELKNITKKDGVDARLVGKLEFYQPLSSVKDRCALRMLDDAEEKGLIVPGVTTLIEPTSGNLGISLACLAAQRGYKFIAVMQAKYSLEKQILIKYMGADVVLTDPCTGYHGLEAKLEELRMKIPNSHVLDQISNPANPDAYFKSTGPEIWKDTAGKIDIFVCGSGTGGTISGTARYLKQKNPALRIIAIEPAESPVLSGGKPGKHGIQGIGPGIIPDCLDTSLIDEVITVTSEEAMSHARRLAREEGILVGISSGAALAASLKVCASIQRTAIKMMWNPSDQSKKLLELNHE